MKGTPRNTQMDSSLSERANSTMVKEGGHEESDDSPVGSGANGLLAMSLQRVMQRAALQGQKRKLDPRKFNGVKSKVAKNVKVLNKTNK